MLTKARLNLTEATADNVAEQGFFCYMSKPKSAGYQRKLNWLKARFAEGMRIKMFELPARGFIEYLPGEYAWRAVEAKGYMFIHCLWVVGKSKGQGLGKRLLKECIKDAREAGMQVKFRLGDWQKILHDLEFGNNIDVVPMFVSAERQLHYDFSTPFLSRYHVLFGRKEMPPLSGINALSGKSVLVQRAGFAAEELRIENSSAIRILTDEEPDALRILSSGKYDYALVPELIGRHAIKTTTPPTPK